MISVTLPAPSSSHTLPPSPPTFYPHHPSRAVPTCRICGPLVSACAAFSAETARRADLPQSPETAHIHRQNSPSPSNAYTSSLEKTEKKKKASELHARVRSSSQTRMVLELKPHLCRVQGTMASTRKHSSERYISNPVPDYATFCVQLRSSASEESGGSGEVSRIIHRYVHLPHYLVTRGGRYIMYL